jgi:dUTP pyrophosphatase
MLNKQQIKKLIAENKLVEGYIDLETQLTPNGFDLTAAEIFEFASAGAVDFSNKERVMCEFKKIDPVKNDIQDKFGWWQLKKGAYKVKTNEVVNMPNNLIATASTRTTLLRMGAHTAHGIWDAGFCGKSEFLLIVENPDGILIKQNARVAQLMFLPAQETESYNGIYKNLK